MNQYPKFRLTLARVNTELYQFSYGHKPGDQQYGWWFFRLNHADEDKIEFPMMTYHEAVRAALVVANDRSALSIEVLP